MKIKELSLSEILSLITHLETTSRACSNLLADPHHHSRFLDEETESRLQQLFQRDIDILQKLNKELDERLSKIE